MTRADLLALSELPAAEAFEAFDAAGLDPETVGLVLGEEAADAYSAWGYLNLK